jgi:hypothetical protein
MKIRLRSEGEIRMGSPYQLCRLTIDADWEPELPFDEFDRRWAESPDGRFVALVAWDLGGVNFPRIRLVILDDELQQVTTSDPLDGGCEELAWTGTGFRCVTHLGAEHERRVPTEP